MPSREEVTKVSFIIAFSLVIVSSGMLLYTGSLIWLLPLFMNVGNLFLLEYIKGKQSE